MKSGVKKAIIKVTLTSDEGQRVLTILRNRRCDLQEAQLKGVPNPLCVEDDIQMLTSVISAFCVARK